MTVVVVVVVSMVEVPVVVVPGDPPLGKDGFPPVGKAGFPPLGNDGFPPVVVGLEVLPGALMVLPGVTMFKILLILLGFDPLGTFPEGTDPEGTLGLTPPDGLTTSNKLPWVVVVVDTNELGLAKLLTLGRVPKILLAAFKVLWALLTDGLTFLFPEVVVVLEVKVDELDPVDPLGAPTVLMVNGDEDDPVDEPEDLVVVELENEEDDPPETAEPPETFKIIA